MKFLKFLAWITLAPLTISVAVTAFCAGGSWLICLIARAFKKNFDHLNVAAFLFVLIFIAVASQFTIKY